MGAFQNEQFSFFDGTAKFTGLEIKERRPALWEALNTLANKDIFLYAIEKTAQYVSIVLDYYEGKKESVTFSAIKTELAGDDLRMALNGNAQYISISNGWYIVTRYHGYV